CPYYCKGHDRAAWPVRLAAVEGIGQVETQHAGLQELRRRHERGDLGHRLRDVAVDADAGRPRAVPHVEDGVRVGQVVDVDAQLEAVTPEVEEPPGANV